MQFDKLPVGAQVALSPWVIVSDIQSILQLDPTLYVVIERHGDVGFEKERNYGMTTTFKLNNDPLAPDDGRWVVSADVQMGSAEEVLKRLGDRAE